MAHSSEVDQYGFELGEQHDAKVYEEFMSGYNAVLARRAGRWRGILDGDKPAASVRSGKLKRYVRKGIPKEHRPTMWMCLSGAEQRRQENPDLYRKLLAGPHDQDLVEVIKIDIHRTFPENIYFQDVQADSRVKRDTLNSVLLAVAHNNKRIGYCQGLNFIAGMLLLVVRDEEKVFWLLDTLINVILQDYYAKDMLGVKVDCEVLGQLIKLKAPAVYSLTEQCDCAWSIVATKWFICLFADVVPVESLLRIWDALFYEGDKILFRVGVTLVKTHQDALVRCRSFPDVMDVFKSMTADSVIINCHEFMQGVFHEPGSFPRSLIARLRQECKAKIEKGEL